MSSSLSVSKILADDAKADLDGLVRAERLKQEKIPWLFAPPGRYPTQQVIDAWFSV